MLGSTSTSTPLSRRNPGSTLAARWALRMKSPADVSSTSERETWLITKTFRREKSLRRFPVATFTYTYDAMGRAATMVDNQSPQFTWAQQMTYNAAGQMTQAVWGGGYITNGQTGQQVPVTWTET